MPHEIATVGRVGDDEPVLSEDAGLVARNRRHLNARLEPESVPDAAAALDEFRARVHRVAALIAAADDRVDALPYVDDTDRRRRLGHLAELLALRVPP